MQFDPRTVARDIPGIFDEIFPQLTPGIVAYFNTQATDIQFLPIPAGLLEVTQLQKAMLFEIGYAVAESLLKKNTIEWGECFNAALRRQRVFYDAELPVNVENTDRKIAEIIGINLANFLRKKSSMLNKELICQPVIPGMEWISSGRGDFSLGPVLIEVKCTNRRFSASDYRQVAIYWLLSYAASLEGHGTEWDEFDLINPRLGFKVSCKFNNFLSIISSGRTKIDILQMFMSLVGSRLNR